MIWQVCEDWYAGCFQSTRPWFVAWSMWSNENQWRSIKKIDEDQPLCDCNNKQYAI